MKKAILIGVTVFVSLWIIFAANPGPKLVNINPPDLSAKPKDLLPGIDVNGVKPGIAFCKIFPCTHFFPFLLSFSFLFNFHPGKIRAILPIFPFSPHFDLIFLSVSSLLYFIDSFWSEIGNLPRGHVWFGVTDGF